MFLHCYAHKLNLVLLHSTKCMPECKAFFKTLEGLSAFFSKSTKRTYLLNNVVKRRLPRTSPTRWSSNSRLMQTVSMYHSDLLMVFRVIGDAEDKWDNDSVMKAAGFERWLLKTNICFLIIAYEEIFNKTDVLFRVLPNKLMDIAFNLDSSGGDKVIEASAHSTRYNIIGGKILFCTEEDQNV